MTWLNALPKFGGNSNDSIAMRWQPTVLPKGGRSTNEKPILATDEYASALF